MLSKHLQEVNKMYPSNNVFILALQGSQNYGIDTQFSDVDSKCLLIPTLHDLTFNIKPTSNTHIMDNNEHIDYKDVRKYFESFRKQNSNFLEILFTKYYYVNPQYEEEWGMLVKAREMIARMDVVTGVKSQCGQAMQKYAHLFHSAPSTEEDIQKYGYSRKNFCHLMRMYDFLPKYIEGEKFENCLKPTNPQYLIDIKLGCYDKEEVKKIADKTITFINDEIFNKYKPLKSSIDENANNILNKVQENIIKKAIKNELLIF